MLVLPERADVERNLVVEEAEAPAQDRPLRGERQQGEAEARGEVIPPADSIAVVPQAQVEGQSATHAPLVLHEGGILLLPEPQHAAPAELDQLTGRAVGALNAHG